MMEDGEDLARKRRRMKSISQKKNVKVYSLSKEEKLYIQKFDPTHGEHAPDKVKTRVMIQN